jgi:hypothetical protein
MVVVGVPVPLRVVMVGLVHNVPDRVCVGLVRHVSYDVCGGCVDYRHGCDGRRDALSGR